MSGVIRLCCIGDLSNTPTPHPGCRSSVQGLGWNIWDPHRLIWSHQAGIGVYSHTLMPTVQMKCEFVYGVSFYLSLIQQKETSAAFVLDEDKLKQSSLPRTDLLRGRCPLNPIRTEHFHVRPGVEKVDETFQTRSNVSTYIWSARNECFIAILYYFLIFFFRRLIQISLKYLIKCSSDCGFLIFHILYYSADMNKIVHPRLQGSPCVMWPQQEVKQVFCCPIMSKLCSNICVLRTHKVE